MSSQSLITGYGIENDGHAGGRHVTRRSWESVQRINREMNIINMEPGQYTENLFIAGMDLAHLGVGGKLRIGRDVILEVTQVGKDDHPSVVARTFGVSPLPKERLFCRVINRGKIRKNDVVEVIS